MKVEASALKVAAIGLSISLAAATMVTVPESSSVKDRLAKVRAVVAELPAIDGFVPMPVALDGCFISKP